MAGCAQFDELDVVDAARPDREAVVIDIRAAHRVDLRPLDMRRAGSVTRLAADIDLGPFGLVGVRFGIEVLAEVGRVAFGAHTVPVLAVTRPVEPVTRRNVFTFV